MNIRDSDAWHRLIKQGTQFFFSEVPTKLDKAITPRFIRRSLSLRMAGAMSFAGIFILVIIAVFVSGHIREGIFTERVQQMLRDAAVRTATVQTRLDQATATTSEQVQGLAGDLMSSTQDSSAGAGAVGVLLLRSSQETSSFVINDIASERMLQVVTEEMRRDVAKGSGQHWQSVAVPRSAGVAPGIVVGSTLQLPLAGTYEFYVVYSLAAEQTTLSMVMRVLVIGSVILLLFFSVVTWIITYRVLKPLRLTVRAAERLSSGDLDARVSVYGEDEMFVLGNSFNVMADSMQTQITQLEELSQLQQRFVSDVSHELRTPLTTMRIAEDVISDAKDQLDPMAARSVELLHTQIERFDSMLADLLEISRIDAGGAVLDREVHDLCDIVDLVVKNNETLAVNLGCTVRVHKPGHPCTAEVDDRRVRRILRNLLVNAIEHSESRPVDISVATTDNAVAVRVRDHGIGMTPEVATRVFDRFFRADPARARTTGGTGLGLAISLEDARLSGGDLQAWGRPDEGASFLLILPRQEGVPAGPSPLPVTDWVGEDEPPVVTAAIPISPGLLGSTAASVSSKNGTLPPTQEGGETS
ncbi:MAG: MtrAB system histidine kinase MtrB [Actinomycetaceae bacterium]|nr:MtrAB system histidine kinase MtrB [Actinomycetaceae bacterium]